MKDLQSLTNHLLAGIRKEIEAGMCTLDLLARQQRSAIARDHMELAAATKSLTAHLALAPHRTARRDRVLAQIAEVLGVPASVLTLKSIAERVGASADPLLEERTELRRITGKIARENKKTAALLLLHRRVVREVLDLFLTDENGNPVEGEGTLVNAEA